jgi:hypothetical protein
MHAPLLECVWFQKFKDQIDYVIVNKIYIFTGNYKPQYSNL